MRIPSPSTVVNSTILGSQGVILPNTVLGIVTASGKLKVAASGSSDGSQTLAAVSTTVIDTSSGDVVAPVIIAFASFQKAGLIYSGSDSSTTFFNALGQAKSGVSLFVY